MILPNSSQFARRGQAPAGEMSRVLGQQNEGSLSTLRGQQHKEKNPLRPSPDGGIPALPVSALALSGAAPPVVQGLRNALRPKGCHTNLQAALVPTSLPSVQQRGLRDDGSGGAGGAGGAREHGGCRALSCPLPCPQWAGGRGKEPGTGLADGFLRGSFH